MKRGSLPKIIVAALVIAFLLVIVLCGCQSGPSTEIEVRVIVTQDFGNEPILDESVAVSEGASALEALQKVAAVETRYGGGFVEAINGLRSQYSGSKVQKDWLFYVNGISANVGALDYKLCDGDVEHWDFHDWSFRAFIPAIISEFPQPFLGGYQGKVLPTVVVYYDEGFQDAAQDLLTGLAKLGVGNISAHAATKLSTQDKEHSNLILLGTEDFELISEMNKNYGKLGFYIHFEDGKVAVWNPRGDDKQCYSDCGLIQATQNPWNPKGIGACENVVWMISGTDKAQVRNTVNVLVNHYEEFWYAGAAIIANGKVIRVPQ